MTKFNIFQRAVTEAYGDGDFQHVKSIADAEDVGDTLFLFLIRELADDPGDPMTVETAGQRMESAIRDLNVAHAAVDQAGGI